jgi:hypothetical protein
VSGYVPPYRIVVARAVARIEVGTVRVQHQNYLIPRRTIATLAVLETYQINVSFFDIHGESLFLFGIRERSNSVDVWACWGSSNA